MIQYSMVLNNKDRVAKLLSGARGEAEEGGGSAPPDGKYKYTYCYYYYYYYY